MRYLEDIPTAEPQHLGSHTVTASEIVEFGQNYDPLPFHLDETAAEGTIHGGLIASGYHTLCIANRIMVDEFRHDVAAVAGLGLDDLQWNAAVYPGDTLQVGHEVIEKRPSASRPNCGILRNRITVLRDEASVLTYIENGMVERRDGADTQ